MIDADQRDVVVQWSQADAMLMISRPFGASTRFWFQPCPAGSDRILLRDAKRVPRSPLNASTRPMDATYSVPPCQTSPSGPCRLAITSTGFAPAFGTT